MLKVFGILYIQLNSVLNVMQPKPREEFTTFCSFCRTSSHPNNWVFFCSAFPPLCEPLADHRLHYHHSDHCLHWCSPQKQRSSTCRQSVWILREQEVSRFRWKCHHICSDWVWCWEWVWSRTGTSIASIGVLSYIYSTLPKLRSSFGLLSQTFCRNHRNEFSYY